MDEDNKLHEINDELKEEIELLNNELCWITVKWDVYVQLFGTSQENINLLNKFAPVAFKVFHDTLYDDILVSICKITERSRTLGKDNLTTARLLDLFQKNDYEDLCNELSVIQKEIKDKYSDIKAQRNKKISHIDLESIKSDFSFLNGISRKNIKDILKLIYKFMNKINLYFYNYETPYEKIPTEGGDGEYLIEQLKKLDEYCRKDDPYWDL